MLLLLCYCCFGSQSLICKQGGTYSQGSADGLVGVARARLAQSAYTYYCMHAHVVSDKLVTDSHQPDRCFRVWSYGVQEQRRAGQPCICMWLGGRAEHDLIWATLDTCAVAPESCGFDRVMGQDGDKTG